MKSYGKFIENNTIYNALQLILLFRLANCFFLKLVKSLVLIESDGKFHCLPVAA